MDQRFGTDDLVRRMRGDLDDFVAAARRDPPALAHDKRSSPAAVRRRVAFGLAAASVAALVAGLALVQHRQGAGPAPSTRPEATEHSTALPVPPTPDGWVVVEWAEVRFSVPPDLSPFDATNGCDAKSGADALVITCPAGSVTVRPSGSGVSGVPSTINGLQAFRSGSAVSLPELGFEVVVERNGASTAPVLDTVGVSTRWRSGHEPAPSVPADWVPFELGRVRVMIPPDWPIDEIDPRAADPDLCGFRGLEPRLLVGRGSLDASTVYCLQPQVVVAPGDGLRIFEVDGDAPVENASGYPLVEVRITDGDQATVPLQVRIGFGLDGSIGRTILGSITVDDGSPTTTPAAAVQGQRYEAVATVLESPDHGAQVCLGGVEGSLPPQCSGPDIIGWSWDAIDGEESASGTTWVDAYLRGRYDPASNEFAIDDARIPTQADRDRLGAADSDPDHGLPCDPPPEGWPTGRPGWPGDRIETIDGYAGAWVDPTQRVMVVKFTGDLDVAEAEVRSVYGGALCVIGGLHTEAELRAIQAQLMGMSSVQFLWSFVNSDLRGEWVEAGVATADPDRQAAFDDEFGDGVVRLVPVLREIGG